MQHLRNLRKIRTSSARQVASGPLFAIRLHPRLRPFFFTMGPAALSITCVCLVALMAVLYLSQMGQAIATNRRIQDVRTEQSTLQRENQDMSSAIAHLRSPGYIAEQAEKMGLEPVDPEAIWIVRPEGDTQSTTDE